MNKASRVSICLDNLICAANYWENILSSLLRKSIGQWAKSPKRQPKECFFFNSAPKIHSYRLLFRKFCPLGRLFCWRVDTITTSLIYFSWLWYYRYYGISTFKAGFPLLEQISTSVFWYTFRHKIQYDTLRRFPVLQKRRVLFSKQQTS